MNSKSLQRCTVGPRSRLLAGVQRLLSVFFFGQALLVGAAHQLNLESATVVDPPSTVELALSLELDDAVDLSALSLRFLFDPSVLTIATADLIAVAERVDDDAVVAVSSPSAGELVWSAAHLLGEAAVLAGPGAVLRLTVTIDSDLLDGPAAITVTPLVAVDTALQPVVFAEVVDSTIAVASAVLDLSIAPTVVDEDGSAVATVSRTGATTEPLQVTLVLSDDEQATAPTVVTIDAGATAAEFTIAAVDDALADGAVIVTLTASADGFANVMAELTVRDNDNALDVDGDGMPTAWEDEHGLDSTRAADAEEDADGDGINNLREFEEDSDPQHYFLALKTGWNFISLARRPVDNRVETIFAELTDGPVWRWDGERFRPASRLDSLVGYWVFALADVNVDIDLVWPDLPGPSDGDLDGDGMEDSWELANDLDPDNAGDAHLDPDGDGASNLQEHDEQSDPQAQPARASSGWLSLSVARLAADRSVEVNFGAGFVDAIWRYADGEYVGVESVSPLAGYWAFIEDEAK